MNLDSDKKKFAVNIILVILLNLVLFFGCFALYYEIRSKKDFIFKIKQDIAFFEKRIENIKQVEKSLKETEDSRLEVESVFLDLRSVIDFIKRLEYFRNQSGVLLEMRGVNIPKDNDEKPVFEFVLTGPFPAIYKYLALLENDFYQSTLDQIYIERVPRSVDWQAVLKLRLLSFQSLAER